MRYDDKGREIKVLQQALLQRGHELPKGGADGHLGDETWNALREYAQANDLPWNPEVPEAVVQALAAIPEPDLVIDLTAEQPDPPPEYGGRRKHWINRGKVVRRSPDAITGIVIHQTAVWYGVSDRQREAAGGDVEKALHKRGLAIGSHLVAFDGQKAGVECRHPLYINPLRWYVIHAHKANQMSLGLEIEGKYPGNAKDDEFIATDRLIETARKAVTFMVEEGRAQGMPIEYIWAHRQSSSTRRNDPGRELWRRVVLEHAVPVLGLKKQPERTWGDGRPIPVDWDSDGVGSY